MNEYTVIVRCLCGCEAYEVHHVKAIDRHDAMTQVNQGKAKHRRLELVTVLKGHCEEA